jgi:hypothetical protein
VAKLYHVHLALPKAEGREWVLPPMTLAQADEAIRDAKRGGLRAWRTVAPEYNLETKPADDGHAPVHQGKSTA